MVRFFHHAVSLIQSHITSFWSVTSLEFSHTLHLCSNSSEIYKCLISYTPNQALSYIQRWSGPGTQRHNIWCPKVAGALSEVVQKCIFTCLVTRSGPPVDSNFLVHLGQMSVDCVSVISPNQRYYVHTLMLIHNGCWVRSCWPAQFALKVWHTCAVHHFICTYIISLFLWLSECSRLSPTTGWPSTVHICNMSRSVHVGYIWPTWLLTVL